MQFDFFIFENPHNLRYLRKALSSRRSSLKYYTARGRELEVTVDEISIFGIFSSLVKYAATHYLVHTTK